MGWFKNKFNSLMEYFGYYSKLPVDMERLTLAYNDRLFEIDGLLQSVGFLEKVRYEINGILTASILLSGQEEFKLENGVLDGVFEKQLETIFVANPDGSLTCKVQIRPNFEEEMEAELNNGD